MEDILGELDRLVLKQKESRLTESEISTVSELIKKLANQETMRDQLPTKLIALPPEVAAQTIFDIVGEMEPANQMDLLTTIIRSADFDKHPGYLRQLEIAKTLLPYPHLALHLLLNLCERVTEGGNKQASPGLLKKFASDILNEPGLLSLKLDDSVGDLQLASLSIMVVGSMAEGHIESGSMQKVLDWLKMSSRKLVIPKQLRRKLENDTRLWDTELKKMLLKMGLIDRIIDINHLPSEVMVTYLSNDTNGGSEAYSSDQPAVDHRKMTEFPVQSEYEKIRNLLNEIEAKSKRADAEILRLKEDLMKAEHVRAFIQRRLEDTQRSLSEAKSYIQSLENMNHELSKKVMNLGNLLEQKEKEYEKNRLELMDMSDRQSEFRIEAFKNKLRKKLRIEYIDFCEIESDEMTLALGENLRMQMKNIFSILKSEGIEFEGVINE